MLIRRKTCWLVEPALVAALICCIAGTAPAQNAAAVPPPADPANPYVVPDGPAAKLAQFIEQLFSQPPPSRQAQKQAIAALKEAANKLLAAKPNDLQAQSAVKVKLEFAKDQAELEELVADLQKARLRLAARMARGGLLTLQASKAVRSPDQFKKAVGDVKSHLETGPIGPTDYKLATSVASLAERTDQAELAEDVLQTFLNGAAKSRDRQLAAMAKAVAPVLRRVSLPGNPMEIEGKLLDGGKFDFSQYRGKAVLVDFWATWCGPCVAEVPNMKKIYEEYHDRGFDIVGISLDRSREPLEKFIQDREIPWTILYDDKGRSVTANYYGISGIPTMILVAPDGNVATLNARGPRLRAKLDELLAAVDSAPVTGSGADTAAVEPDAGDSQPRPIVIKITAKGVTSIDGDPLGGRHFLNLIASMVAEADRASTLLQIEGSADVKPATAARGIAALKKLGFRQVEFVPASG